MGIEVWFGFPVLLGIACRENYRIISCLSNRYVVDFEGLGCCSISKVPVQEVGKFVLFSVK